MIPRRPHALLLALTAIALALLATSRHGPGFSYDGVRYIAAARNLVEGRGFSDVTGAPLTLWPPLFSALIALPFGAGVDPLEAARWLNALAFAAVILLVFRILEPVMRWKALALLFGAGLLVSRSMIERAAMVHSEMIFTAGLLLFVAVMARHRVLPSTLTAAGAAACAGLAFLTRYVGAILVPAGVLLLATTPFVPWRRRLKHLAVHLLVAGAPIALWCGRNWTISGTLLGPRYESPFGFHDNLAHSADILTRWILPGLMPYPLRVIAGAVVAAAILLLLARTLRSPGGPAARSAPFLPRTALVLATLSAAGFYALAVFASVNAIALDPVDDRYYMPLLPLAAILAALALDEAAVRGRFARRAVPILVALGLIVPASGAARFLARSIEGGIGDYASDGWRTSPLMERLATRPARNLFSNDPDAVYIHAALRARSTPLSTEDPALVPPGAHVAWFDLSTRRHIRSEAEVVAAAGLVLDEAFPDGRIYVVP